MNFDDQVRALKPQIEALMDHGARINLNLEGRYFYPLSCATYGPSEVLAALEPMLSFRTTMWSRTAEFESAFAHKFGGEAIMVNSGSSADLLIAFALHELSGGPLSTGDEILAPSVTWPTQIWSLLMAGFSVKLVDTDTRTLNVDFDDLEAKISERTKAISLVHLMGNPVDMDRLMTICLRHNLLIIEDCCESMGASWGDKGVGNFGLAGSFSFFFSHHITTMEGGMIVAQSHELAERMRLLRAHGWSRNLRTPGTPTPGLDSRYTFLSWGFNVRPTEPQAAFGLVQLGRYSEFQNCRIGNVEIFQQRLARHRERLSIMEVPEKGHCSWFALPIIVNRGANFSRDELTTFLEANGVETRPIVAGNIASHPASAVFPQLNCDHLPGAEFIHDAGFYIGIHPISEAHTVGVVCDLFDDFMMKVQ